MDERQSVCLAMCWGPGFEHIKQNQQKINKTVPLKSPIGNDRTKRFSFGTTKWPANKRIVSAPTFVLA